MAEEKENGYFAAYAGFSQTLRAWFVAYGIGAPVLILSNEDIFIKVEESDILQCVGVMFLIGVALQVIVAIVYKTAMWYLYVGEDCQKIQKTLRYKWSDRISEWYLVEALIDLLTLSFFSCATYKVLMVF